jgi:PHP family Zn ribbon phosphoesterase
MGLIAKYGTEFDILMRISDEEVRKGITKSVADGILRMRKGKVSIQPGYDGEYGIISIKGAAGDDEAQEKQLSLF